MSTIESFGIGDHSRFFEDIEFEDAYSIGDYHRERLRESANSIFIKFSNPSPASRSLNQRRILASSQKDGVPAPIKESMGFLLRRTKTL